MKRAERQGAKTVMLILRDDERGTKRVCSGVAPCTDWRRGGEATPPRGLPDSFGWIDAMGDGRRREVSRCRSVHCGSRSVGQAVLARVAARLPEEQPPPGRVLTGARPGHFFPATDHLASPIRVGRNMVRP